MSDSATKARTDMDVALDRLGAVVDKLEQLADGATQEVLTEAGLRSIEDQARLHCERLKKLRAKIESQSDEQLGQRIKEGYRRELDDLEEDIEHSLSVVRAGLAELDAA